METGQPWLLNKEKGRWGVRPNQQGQGDCGQAAEVSKQCNFRKMNVPRVGEQEEPFKS